ncbi:MAG: hypothetical protein ACXWEY_16030 [Bacteroidia bacterium]
MRVNLLKTNTLFLFIIVLFFGSCARQSNLSIRENNELQYTQLPDVTVAEKPEINSEKWHEQKQETTPEINQPGKAKTEKNSFSSRLKTSKIANTVTKKSISIISKNLDFAQHKSTKEIKKDTPDALKMVGLIFVIFGLIALIPPLAFSVGSYMFIIAGILLALGALFLLTGSARSAEK